MIALFSRSKKWPPVCSTSLQGEGLDPKGQVLMGMNLVIRAFILSQILFVSTCSFGQSYTIPRSPLQISNSGFIMAPREMRFSNEFATILEGGEIKQFTNVLLSRGEPLSARGVDGVYRKVHLDTETGALKHADGSEVQRKEVLADLKDYFVALNMESHTLVQKFMQRYFASSGSDAQPEALPQIEPIKPTEGSHSEENGTGPKQGRPTEVQPNTNQNTENKSKPDSSSQNNESGTNPTPQSTVEASVPKTEAVTQPEKPVNKFNKRFSLSTYVKAARRKIINGREFVDAGNCGASVISKREVGSLGASQKKQCEFAVYSGGHCFPTESEIYLNGDPRKPALEKMVLTTPSGKKIKADGDRVEVRFSENFNGRRRFVQSGRGYVLSDTAAPRDDYALVFLKTDCEAISADEIAQLGNVQLENNERISAISQDNTEVGMSVQLKSTEGDGSISSQLERIGSVRPGDSGGPVFNSRGKLIGAVATISVFEGQSLDQAHAMTFNPKGIIWAQEQLQSRLGVVKAPDDRVCDPKTGVCRPKGSLSGLPEASPLVADSAKSAKSAKSEVGHTTEPDIAPAAPIIQSPVPRPKVTPTPTPNPSAASNQKVSPNPRRTSGGLVEVGPVRGADLRRVWEKAKQLGFRHIITRFGNDAGCGSCRVLRDSLRKRFGSNSDVLVIKVEDSVRDPKVNLIPQSELISLDDQGQWRQHGDLQVGSDGTAQKFSQSIEGIRQRESQLTDNGHSKTPQPQPRTEPRPKSLPRDTASNSGNIDFECIASQGGYRPIHKTARIPLGAGPMPSKEICFSAIRVSRNGIVCSATGLEGGYKPTYLRGKTASRPDYGYVGGSSMTLAACLYAVENSSATHVCYYGGNSGVRVGNENTPSWYATHPTGDNSHKGGPFNNLTQCVASYGGAPKVAQKPPAPAPIAQNPSPTAPAPIAQNPSPIGPIQASPKDTAPPQTRGFSSPAEPSAKSPEVPQTRGLKVPPKNNASKEQSVHVTPSSLKGHELIQSNCNTCHGKSVGALPNWLTQAGEFERRLGSSNPTERGGAIKALNHLNQVLNVDNSMPPRADLNEAFNNNPEAQKFKAWIKEQADKHSGHSATSQNSEAAAKVPRATASTSPARNAVKLLDPQRERAYRALLPEVENPELAAILKDPNTIFYDKASMVPGYQDPSTPVVGVRTTEPGFKGAGFAEGATGLYLDSDGHLKMFHTGVGLEQAGNTATFHFLNLPKDAQGNLQKIKVKKRIVPPDDAVTYDWIYPVGTVSGEVVVNKNAAGQLQVLEIRTRKKDNAQGAWAPDIARPYPTAQSLRERLTQIAETNPSLRTEAQGLLTHLNNPNRLIPVQIPRSGFQKGNFASSGGTDVLPNMSPTMVSTLLATKFKSSLGAEWDRNGSTVAFAPTTRQADGIAPQNSKSGAIQVGRQSCAKCHEDANKPINNFFPENHPQFYSSIRAYGNLPGSDRNLRFTIFDQTQFPFFGHDGRGDNRKINPKLIPILEF